MKVPIAEVMAGGTKSEFYAELRKTLNLCVRATNRAVTEYAKLDRRLWESTGKPAKMPKDTPIYKLINGMFPPLCSHIAASLSRAAGKKYRDERYRLFANRVSLPICRSCPYPLLPSQGKQHLNVSQDNDGNVLIRLKLIGTDYYTLRLRGGSNYARQIRTIKDAIEIGDSKIWIHRKSGVATIGLACKMEAKPIVGTGVLRVATDRDNFIVATKAKSDIPFTITGDQVHKWAAEARRKQERLRQDSKSGQRRKLRKVKQDASEKYDQRIKSFIRESVAHLVKHAKRRRVAGIAYDDTIRSYFRNFQWHELATHLENKCEEIGLTFEHTAKEILPALDWEPHVYFAAAVIDGKATGKVKIGYTSRTKSKRRRELEGMGGQELIMLATDRLPQAKLRAREKELHAKFSKVKMNNGVGREWFELEPIVEWLREIDCLGNSGNRSQVMQILDI